MTLKNSSVLVSALNFPLVFSGGEVGECLSLIPIFLENCKIIKYLETTYD